MTEKESSSEGVGSLADVDLSAAMVSPETDGLPNDA